MSWPRIVERLKAGEAVELHPKGNSMTPRIKSGQRVLLEGHTDVRVGDVALAKVKGRYYLHLISAIDGRRVQISNNHGHVNGCTTMDKVFGIITEVG